MFGLAPEDYAEEWTVEVWPDVWPVLMLFASLGSQWRVGPSGPYGLDYNVLYHKMDRMNLTAEEYAELEEDIRVLEQSALDEMHKE